MYTASQKKVIWIPLPSSCGLQNINSKFHDIGEASMKILQFLLDEKFKKAREFADK